jgi:hypothetical protein
MANAYLVSSTYRGGPEPGQDPHLSINENMPLNQAVPALVTQMNRQHMKPATLEKLYIVAEGKKGAIFIGMGLSVSTVKTLAPIQPFMKPGRDRVGCELVGFKIGGEVANRDLAQAIAATLQVSVLADGETFHPKRA